MPGQQLSCVLQLTGTAAARREIYPQSPGGCMLPNKILAIFPIYLSIFWRGAFLGPFSAKPWWRILLFLFNDNNNIFLKLPLYIGGTEGRVGPTVRQSRM